MKGARIEIAIHVIVLLFLLTSVNVDWTSNWFDQSIRPKSPSPLSVIAFFFFFYINAFYLIPRFFSFEKWKQYLLGVFCFLLLPEVLRILFYLNLFPESNFEKELFSRDGFIFGAPSAFFMAVNTSFIYRFARDWFVNKKKIKELEKEKENPKTNNPYEDVELLSKEEASQLEAAVLLQLEKEQLFLNSKLTLRELAEKTGTNEKKLSYLINQHLDSNFYELVNKYRVEQFKKEVTKTENDRLSIVGIALDCGFPSKSSFYRAFKSEVGSSPSAYVKEMKKSQ